MTNLRFVATLIDTQFPTISYADATALLPKFDTIAGDLAADDELPDDVREFVHSRLQEARRAVADFDTLGKVDLPAAIKRLAMGLFAAADRTPNVESKKRFRERAGELGIQALFSAAGQIAGAAFSGFTGMGM